jgi:hypothetical protein
MKKASLQSLVNYLNGETVTNLDEIKAEIEAELGKGEAKAQANRDLYASAHDIVMNGLRMASVPVTIGELYESIADELPDGFSKGKVQYAITRLWADEVVKTEGKVNTYSVKE